MRGITDFKGKNAIVTGAGSGIGRELALQLADKGCRVIITDIHRERIDEVLSQIKAKGLEAEGYCIDHSRFEEVENFAREYFERWGRIDILCSNAGIGVGSHFRELTIKDWEWVMGINLWGAIYMLHHFVPKMIDQRGGSILITASGAGLIGLPGMAPYCTSKFAMLGLAESLRGELYKYNIKVSALCPGIINTNIIRDGKIMFADASGSSRQSLVDKFYQTFGVLPAVVAKQGISALRCDTGIKVSPRLQMWPVYILKRLSPTVYQGISRLFFKYLVFRDSG